MTDGSIASCRCGDGSKCEHHAHLPGRNPSYWNKVTVEDLGYTTHCHVWQGARTEQGYAKARRVVAPYQYKKILLHRWFYTQAGNTIPEGYNLHHLCEVKNCVNPEHLRPMPVDIHTQLHRQRASGLSSKDIRAIQSSGKTTSEAAAEFGIPYYKAWRIRKKREKT